MIEAKKMSGVRRPGPRKPNSVQTHHDVRALVQLSAIPLVAVPVSMAQMRGYARQDLLVISEIAYHYLLNGGTEIAQALFDGLVAIAPEEAYFVLARGLTCDRLGDKERAHECYRIAADLDPRDGRADINRAELFIEADDHIRARELLLRGTKKAEVKGDALLAKKGRAILEHLDTCIHHLRRSA